MILPIMFGLSLLGMAWWGHHLAEKNKPRTRRVKKDDKQVSNSPR